MISGFCEYGHSEDRPPASISLRLWEEGFCCSQIDMIFGKNMGASVRTSGNQVSVWLQVGEVLEESRSYGLQMDGVLHVIAGIAALAKALVEAFESRIDYDLPSVAKLKAIYDDFFEDQGINWKQ